MSPELLPLALASPLLIYMAVSDFHAMRIPNWLVLALIAVFAVSSPMLLSGDDITGRLLTACTVFVVGFLAFLVRVMAGGDAKALAALALFIPAGQQSLALFGFTLSAALVLGIGLMTLLRWKLGHPASPHLSLATARGFPMGISIGLAGLAFPAVQLWV